MLSVNMGKRKFNAKGRQVVNTIIDNSETKKVRFYLRLHRVTFFLRNRASHFHSQIKLEDGSHETEQYGGYDHANALVLPSKKRDTKIQKTKEAHVTRILSKKQRKNLEKIVDKKKKKHEVSAKNTQHEYE